MKLTRIRATIYNYDKQFARTNQGDTLATEMKEPLKHHMYMNSLLFIVEFHTQTKIKMRYWNSVWRYRCQVYQ